MAVKESNILQEHDAHPLILDLYITKKMGPEWWEWEPETLREMLQRDFPNQSISQINWNKLQAVRTVHVSPGFVFDEWECFLPVITALNNVIPDFDVLQVPTPARLYAGVGMLRMLDPEEDFSAEIKKWVAAALLFDGIYFAPGELKFAQELIRRPYYVCPRCGNKEELLFDHDGICDSCGKEWHSKATGRVINNSPVVVKYTYDEGPVRARFQQVANNWDAYVPDEDDPIDVQICRIANAISYKSEKDAAFLSQKKDLNL